MAEMRECSSKNLIKAKAIRLLMRKNLYKNQVESLRSQSLKMKEVNLIAQNQNKKAKVVTRNKKNNTMSEKLRSLYKNIVKRS